MNHPFNDIRSRITEPPTWWDMNGTPRWGDFHPTQSPDIYTREAVLLEIQCQCCRQPFRVELHADFDLMHRTQSETPLADAIKNKSIHYGDPPHHDDPQDPSWGCTGNSMNVYDMRVLEYWRQTRPEHEWKRDADLEVEIENEDIGE